jgi:hypothetical protein
MILNQKYFKTEFLGGLAMQSAKQEQSLQLATGLSATSPRSFLAAGFSLLSLPETQYETHHNFLFLLFKIKGLFPRFPSPNAQVPTPKQYIK